MEGFSTEAIAAIVTAASTSFLLFLDQRAKQRVSEIVSLRKRLHEVEGERDDWRERYNDLRERYIDEAEAEIEAARKGE